MAIIKPPIQITLRLEVCLILIFLLTCAQIFLVNSKLIKYNVFCIKAVISFLFNNILYYSYKKSVLDFGVNRTNIQYGGRLPQVRNVIFSNGDVDPWHSLSILKDLNDFSPAIIIPGEGFYNKSICILYISVKKKLINLIMFLGASHCQDLKKKSSNDPPEMQAARIKIMEIVSNWITSN